MKTAFCILTCLLSMGFATQARTAEPPPKEKKQADEAMKSWLEERKTWKAIWKLGGSAFPHCPWVDGLMVIVEEEKFTDADLERLKAFPQIKGIDLSGTQVTDAGLKHLKVFTKLRRLELNETKITDAGLEHTSGLADLELLSVDHTKVTDAGLKHLKGLAKLESLGLQDTLVTDVGLEYLSGLPRLASLDLSGSRVTGEGVRKLKKVLRGCRITNSPMSEATAYNEGQKHCARAVDFAKKGEYDRAVAEYSDAIHLRPYDVLAFRDRGTALANLGEYDKAIADFSEVIERDPAAFGSPYSADAHSNRGDAWAHKGQYEKAIADYGQALEFDRDDVKAFNALARLLATCPDEKYRDGRRAVENATKACHLTEGKNWVYISTLAAAYAESGDFEKAKEWQAKAIKLAEADKTATEKDKVEARSRLELYKQNKPYREEPKKRMP